MTVTIDTPIHPANVTPLRHARVAAGLTQHELAEMVGWSRSLIALVETGRRSLDDDQREAVAGVLEDARQARLERRQQIGQMLDEMPLKPEHLAMLHGGG